MSWKDEALYRSLVKIEKNITAVGEHFPHVSYDGIYREEPAFFGHPAFGRVFCGFCMRKPGLRRRLNWPERWKNVWIRCLTDL